MWSSEAGCVWVPREPPQPLSQAKFYLTQAGLATSQDSDIYSRIMGWVGLNMTLNLNSFLLGNYKMCMLHAFSCLTTKSAGI